MFGNRAEGAATKTAAHDVDRKTDHVPGRYLGFAIRGMWRPRVSHIVDAIHLIHFERNRRRRQPDIAFTMCLHQGARIARIRFKVKYPRGMRIHDRISLHLFVGRQADHALFANLAHLQLPLFTRQNLDRLDGSRGISGGIGGGIRGAALRVLGFHFIRIGMRFDLAWRIDPGRVDFTPVFGRLPAARDHEGGAA